MKNYELEKNRGKVFGYRRAINALRAYPNPITDVKLLDDIEGIGPKTIDKIKEFLEKGTFREIKDPFSKKKMQELEEL